jgi:hypothetical protein
LAKIIEECVAMMDEAERVGVPIDHLAGYIGVSRPTLYRWQQAAAIRGAHGAGGVA